MEWFRSWHGAPLDPKWRVVARISGRPVCEVVAVVWYLLDRASQGTPRGTIGGLDPEVVEAALDVAAADVEKITAALAAKNFMDDSRVVGWEKHQPKREDNSAGRTREYRERQRDAPVTQRDASDALVTQRDAPVTQRDARGEESRGEKRREKEPSSLRSESPSDATRSSDVTDENSGTSVTAASPPQEGKRQKDQKPETELTLTPTGELVLAPAPPSVKPEFDAEFWPAWPNKVAKQAALKAWPLARRKTDLDTIIRAVNRYRAELEADPTRPAMHPATFLNGERWNDAPRRPIHRQPSRSEALLEAVFEATEKRFGLGGGETSGTGQALIGGAAGHEAGPRQIEGESERAA